MSRPLSPSPTGPPQPQLYRDSSRDQRQYASDATGYDDPHLYSSTAARSGSASAADPFVDFGRASEAYERPYRPYEHSSDYPSSPHTRYSTLSYSDSHSDLRGFATPYGARSDRFDRDAFGLPPERWEKEGRGGGASTWLAKQQRGMGRSRKWVVLGTALLFVALVAIIVGVVIGLRSAGGHGLGTGNNVFSEGLGVVKAKSPSDFEKDPNLHNAFYGMAYSPFGSVLPWCGATQGNVTEDMQLLSQLTNRIRLYGGDCNQTALVLQAIQDTKVQMQVFLGIYIDTNDTVYERQRDTIKDALQTYGVDHVAGITVGNEYILNQMTAAGTSDPTTPAGIKASDFILDKITDARKVLGTDLGHADLKFGTADAGSAVSARLCAGADYVMANVHPWFGSVDAQGAAAWTWNFFQEFDVDVCAQASNNPDVYIAETGWPTNAMTEAERYNENAHSEASDANLQVFLDTFVCQANNNGTKYFFFEMFDEMWKVQFGNVEPYWGLFGENKILKPGLKIPACSHP